MKYLMVCSIKCLVLLLPHLKRGLIFIVFFLHYFLEVSFSTMLPSSNIQHTDLSDKAQDIEIPEVVELQADFEDLNINGN